MVEAGEAGGFEEIVLLDGLAIGGHQGAFLNDRLRPFKLAAKTQGHTYFASHLLKGYQLLLFLVVVALELMVLAAEGIDFRTEGIVIGYFPGHPEVA
jgi:hypothetical protein